MVALAKQYHKPIKPIDIRNEWYTPSRYTDAACIVMGSIDLDPASCAEANLVVQANRYFTREDNGLEQPWHGNVWMNPPFVSENNKSNFVLWSRKLLNEYLQGNISQAIALVSATPERKWFQPFWQYPICFTDHQIVFNRAYGKPDHLYTCTCFIYLGSKRQKFMEVFSEIGYVIPGNIAIRKPANKPLSLWEVN